MGRDAAKSVGNVWYEARLSAAKTDPRLSSREGASELLGMSLDSIRDAECGLSKTMPIDKALTMSQVYKAPELLPQYCLTECPMGGCVPLSCEKLSLPEIAVRMAVGAEDVAGAAEEMIRIAYDGVVSPDEVDGLDAVRETVETLMRSMSEFWIFCNGFTGNAG